MFLLPHLSPFPGYGKILLVLPLTPSVGQCMVAAALSVPMDTCVLCLRFVSNVLTIDDFEFAVFVFQYDVPTYVGMLEEEVKDELMETDVPSEGKDFLSAVMVIQK